MLEEEYGSSEPVKVWNPKPVDIYDNVIQIPSCDKCKSLMQMVIGQEVYAWVCQEC